MVQGTSGDPAAVSGVLELNLVYSGWFNSYAGDVWVKLWCGIHSKAKNHRSAENLGRAVAAAALQHGMGTGVIRATARQVRLQCRAWWR